MRHKWFPALVIATASGWWLWQATHGAYHTLVHVIVVLASIITLAIWFLIYGRGSRRTRIATIAALGIGIAVFFATFRPVYNGDMGVYRWRLRFAKNADELLKQPQTAGEIVDWKATPNDYPRFLGNGYWPEVKGVELETDWKTHPPQELWCHEIGAGWSAFAIVGDYAFTQEQRGENELVTCYRLQTGEPIWTHADQTRFDPADAVGSLGDVGPRATPTIQGDHVFTQGGTGIVNCLDARTGNVIWSHDTVDEFGTTVATWGKAGSPLIVDDVVVVSVGAPSVESTSSGVASTGERDDNRLKYDSSLVAFDIATGGVRWQAGSRKAAYASPVLATLAGTQQILVVNESWLTAHRAADGKVLWEFPWSNEHDTTASCATCAARWRPSIHFQRLWRWLLSFENQPRPERSVFRRSTLAATDQAGDEKQIQQRSDARRLCLRARRRPARMYRTGIRWREVEETPVAGFRPRTGHAHRQHDSRIERNRRAGARRGDPHRLSRTSEYSGIE